jgi:hypothetical protein
MKFTILAITFLPAFSLCAEPSAQVDPRFQGVWVGMETYSINTSATQQAQPPEHMAATVVIDPASGAFGVLQGLGPGKYKIAERSRGNKIFFASHLSGTGRTGCTFTLSADGNTLTETGFGLYPCKPYACECNITATLHRKGK